MAIASVEIEVTVSGTPDDGDLAKIAVQTDQILSGDTSRPFRFTVVRGGRNLWHLWFDNKPIYIRYQDGPMYQAQIAAFPTNPRTDYGYIQLVRSI